MSSGATKSPPSEDTTAPTAVRPRRFTREEYFCMVDIGVLGPTDRTELVNGYLVEMTAQNAPHRASVAKIDRQFQKMLGDRAYWVQTQSTFPLDCRDVPEPDVAILGGTPDDLLDGEPDDIPLIIEVSDTTLAYDRTDKRACYASNDISEYWIVNLRNRTLECYRGPADDEYRERRTLDPADTVVPEFDDALSVRVEALLPAQPDPDPDSDDE
jgi:Uma2 family endonuclease